MRLSPKHLDARPGEMSDRWRLLSFENGWVNYDAGYAHAAYCIDDLGWVCLRGLIKNASSPPPGGPPHSRIARLPLVLAPAWDSIFATEGYNNVTGYDFMRIDIRSKASNAGIDYLIYYSTSVVYLPLDGIRWKPDSRLWGFTT